MVVEYDEKGKYYTDVIKKEVILCHIQTKSHCIKGHIHIRKGDRLSDEINRDNLFLAVTDAQVSSLDSEILFRNDFLAVNREQIVWLMPIEEHRDGQE